MSKALSPEFQRLLSVPDYAVVQRTNTGLVVYVDNGERHSHFDVTFRQLPHWLQSLLLNMEASQPVAVTAEQDKK